MVVEKQLKKNRDLSRHDIGREAFVAEAMKWKVEKEAYIYKQLRKSMIFAILFCQQTVKLELKRSSRNVDFMIS